MMTVSPCGPPSLAGRPFTITLRNLVSTRKPQFKIYFRRRMGSGKFNLPYDRAGFKLRL